MKGSRSGKIDPRRGSIKSTIALVLAGGYTGEFKPGNTPMHKALLPVCGNPVADFVVQALEQSEVEKIYVVQDEGAQLQETLAHSSKCTFLTKGKQDSSLARGFLFAMERIAEAAASSGSQYRVMIVPCDTPLVTKDNFNALIEKAASKTADVTVTIIAARHLEKRFPGKHFRRVYLADYKECYTMQNVIFMDGDFIQFKPGREPGGRNFTFRGWDEAVMKRVVDGINSVEDLRHQPHFHDKLLLLWLLTKGYTLYIFRLLIDLAFRRLTMTRAIKYLNGADHMNSAFIESEEVEFSADIDHPEDLQGIIGIPYHA